MNDEKKPNSLTGQIGSPVKYEPKKELSQEESLKEAEKIKKELDEFKKKVVKKFPFTLALGILPSNSFKMFEEEEGFTKEEIEKKHLHLIMIIPEEQYKNIPKKIKPEVVKLAQESKQNLWIHIKDTVDLWGFGLDSKFEYLDAVGGSYPLHDKGLLGSLRVASIHKTLVLRKFEKYVASYVIGGSLVRGTADKTSDVDTFVIIDDTDVKRMPRLQLLEKLKGIIYDYIREATALAGVKNILNVQIYLLTDFWDSVKDANPVMFTFIRDGVPMYDRGTFLPWKLLLQMGKIKPSPEAVDKFMKYGEQNDALVNRRLLDAMVDIYYGVITPTQALMMLAGHAPPPPKTIIHEVRELFVDKEKIMAQKELKTLEKAVKYFKDYEHGRLKKISGKEVDELLEDSKYYDKKMKELRSKLEAKLIEKDAEKIHSDVFGLLKNIFGSKGKDSLISNFEKEFVKKGKMQQRFVDVLKDVGKIKTKLKTKKMSHVEMDKIKKNATELVNELVDYSQRKELIAVEKGVLQIFHSGKKSEFVLTDKGYFLVSREGIKKIHGKEIVKSDRKELEEAISKTKDRTKMKIDSEVFGLLKKELGNFEILF